MATIYIAGPMRDYPNFNFPAFDEAAKILRGAGWEVLSPAEHDREDGFDETKNSLEGFDVQAALRWDIEAILRSDAIALLPGWEKSAGVAVELTVAQAIALNVFLYEKGYTHNWVDDDPLFHLRPYAKGDPRFHAKLREIAALHDKKQADYGTDADPFANVRGSQEWGVAPWLGAMIRANDKVKRLKTFAQKGSLANEGVADSFMDLAVYALIALVLFEEEE